MITPSFSLTATERVLPKLALDFTTANLDSRVSFTRTTNATNPATYTNSSGNVALATDNQPRFDYDPVALTCKGLLIEESRTNLFTYSEQFNSADWSIAAATITPDAVLSPMGAMTADKIVATGGLTEHNAVQSKAVVSGTSYTFSCYFKAAEISTYELGFRVGSLWQSGNSVVSFNLSNGTATVTSGAPTYSITNVGNGWYRCTVTQTAIANGTAQFRIQSTFNADGSGIYIWGAQLEAGAFATSYIPTTTTALTRNADVATMTGTNFSSWFNATQGSFVTTFDTRYPIGGGTGIAILADTSTAIWPTYIHSTGKAAMYDGTNLALTSGNVPAYPTVSKIATRYGSSEQAVSLNGSARATSASAGYAGLSGLRLGSATSNIVPLCGHIQKMFYYSVKFTDNEMKAFST